MNDTDLINYLEKLHADNKYSDVVVLRLSETGRGWRLHSSSLSRIPPLGRGKTVREAILDAMEDQ